MSQSEMAVLDIASWMVEEAGDEFTLILTDSTLNYNSQRTKLVELAERLYDTNKADDALKVSLRKLSTHPSVQLSGMREAIGHVTRGFSAYSSTQPDNWFEMYYKRTIEQKASERPKSAPKRLRVEAVSAPSPTPLFMAPQFEEAVAL